MHCTVDGVMHTDTGAMVIHVHHTDTGAMMAIKMQTEFLYQHTGIMNMV